MTQLSRRGFLIAAAGCSAGLLLPGATSAAAATTPAVPRQTGRPANSASSAADVCTPNSTPSVLQASGQLGTVSALVRVRQVRDVTALRYQLTNTSDAPDTYVVSYTDDITTFDSHAVTITLQPGQVKRGALHGYLYHQFTFYVDLSDGTTLTLGPVGQQPTCELGTRKWRQPIYGAPKRHHGKG
jgi:hypothetical protein